MLSLGIDIGGSSVKAAVLRDGVEVGRGRSAPHDGCQIAQVLGGIRTAARAALDTCNGDEIGSVGLCVPGILEESGAAVVRSVNVPVIVGVPLAELVHRAISPSAYDVSRLRVVSDARAATHDAAVTRSLKGRVLGISLGTGVGAAVLDDLVPLHVSGSSSGHMGQWDVTLDDHDPSTPIASDGGRGGLEAYIGLKALRDRYDLDQLPERIGRFTHEDPPLRALARAIRIAHALYRPDHVVLLGGVGISLAPATSELRTMIADRLTSLARDGWALSCGEDLFHAARGAARLSREGPPKLL